MNEEKVVLVTGSSRGIGKAIAKEFAVNKYKVIINCKNSTAQLEDTLNELKKINEHVFAIQGDVSDYNETCEMFNKIHSICENVDILINNAGISYIGLFNQMKPESWKYIMNTNLDSVYNCTHKVLPYMINKKKGTIINISSIWGNNGASCEAVYSASKGAINSFTKSLAKELGPCNIRVNAIACGIIDTEMNNCFSFEEKNELIENIPLMRMGSIEDIAKLALFLASENSSYITGQIITIDGSFT